jgi:hypothetical protein
MRRGLFVLALLTCLALPAAASADGDYTACSTAEGNRLAGPHPFLDGALLDEDGPGYTPFSADAYMNDDETWLCVRVGAVGQRVVVPAASPVAPPTGPVWDLITDPPVWAENGGCRAEGTPIATATDTFPDFNIRYTIGLYQNEDYAELCFGLQAPSINWEDGGDRIHIDP